MTVEHRNDVLETFQWSNQQIGQSKHKKLACFHEQV